MDVSNFLWAALTQHCMFVLPLQYVVYTCIQPGSHIIWDDVHEPLRSIGTPVACSIKEPQPAVCLCELARPSVYAVTGIVGGHLLTASFTRLIRVTDVRASMRT
jgi:hypothetical protein